MCSGAVTVSSIIISLPALPLNVPLAVFTSPFRSTSLPAVRSISATASISLAVMFRPAVPSIVFATTISFNTIFPFSSAPAAVASIRTWLSAVIALLLVTFPFAEVSLTEFSACKAPSTRISPCWLNTILPVVLSWFFFTTISVLTVNPPASRLVSATLP